jgi:SPP1 gp7 family putative phage head morphogenesis protein
MVGLADDYARALDEIEARAGQNTIATIRRSLQGVLADLRRHYTAYTEALGPQGYDPARNAIRRPGEYSALEATAKYRAIIADAQQFLTDLELEAWRVRYETDLREAARLGGELGLQLQQLVGAPAAAAGTAAPLAFTGADPAALRAASTTVSALIRGESVRFRDQLIQIVGEGATRGWGPSQLELQIRRALRGAKDPNGITQRLGLEQRASLIARSELAAVYAQGALARARERGDAYVRVLASNDERVCPTCAARNGRVYPVDRVILPFHPRCRCVAAPVSNEAVQERDPAARSVLLDNERWQEEHERGVQAYAEGQHQRTIDGLRRQERRLTDPDAKDAMAAKINRLIERGPDMVKARLELSRALRTPTASEKRLFPGRSQSLAESVGLFE